MKGENIMKNATIYFLAAWVMLSSIVVNVSANSTDVSYPLTDSIVLVQGKETPKKKKRSTKGAPEIVFLDFARRGDSAILFWEVKYADKIIVGEADPQSVIKFLIRVK